MATSTVPFKLVYFIAFLEVVISATECLNRNSHANLDFHAADNRTLNGSVYASVNVPSRVKCGRDCSMDRRCKSFNYDSKGEVCQLNSKAWKLCTELVISLGAVYFDRNKDTPLLSLPDTSVVPKPSCKELFNAGFNSSGVYTIYPGGNCDGGIQVFCDMTLDGGGWTVVTRRQDGSVDFYRNWTDYQAGFGDLSGEFWLGNDNLVTLTSDDSRGTWEVQFDLEDWEGNKAWARYEDFKITGELYTLNIGTYDALSTAGDGFGYNRGYPFSTKDRENSGNCAQHREGAWWYYSCSWVQLTGVYYPNQNADGGRGIVWNKWTGSSYSLKKATMKIRETVINYALSTFY